MSASQWWLLALAAVLVFWMVGGYNRLVALRTAIGQAFAQLEPLLQQRRQALEPLVALLKPALHEADAADALQGALLQVQAAAEAVRSKPVATDSVATLVTAEQTLAAALARVFALLEHHPGLRDQAPEVAHAHSELASLEPKLAFARQLFNAAADQYNDAACQFPTSVLKALYGFGVAGRL